ncbi:MAG TPA: urea carboxylase [Rhizomicrobium sp.]|jgi:urea carboxylase
MFKTVLVANRGEIAARIIRTLSRMGVASVAVASDADRFTAPMRAADRLVRLGPGPAAATYLDVEAIIRACHETNAQAVHPGYGFLSENIGFAERCAREGIAFIGPRPDHIRAFGLKHTARDIAQKAGVPLLPGSGLLDSADHALTEAERIGYPVMLKSTAGGGGIGMQLCLTPQELAQKYESVARLASGNFGDARMYLERFVSRARHVEVQIFGDGMGEIRTLGERDCSLQRRNQKVVEETPAPNLPDAVRENLREAATALGQAISYESAGTVEFVYDVDRQQPYFLEVNTRLQVEHPVTEEIFGVDLVEWMIRQAAGDFTLPAQDSLQPRGHAIEARLYAENPAVNFRPSTGVITDLHFPADARIESWIETGAEVSSFYDPMLAKIVVRGETRVAALTAMDAALVQTKIWGVETNLGYLSDIVAAPAFRKGEAVTATLKDFVFQPRSVEVVAPGAQSSLQDAPGRLHYWHVGIPPSGPMDGRSHALTNRIVGNAVNAATLECTLSGPMLRFHSDALIALGGAEMGATLDGAPVVRWQPTPVRAGQVLSIGKAAGEGMRAYLAVRGGFDAPLYLGSRATFSLGGFGGHATGVLKAGDTLRLGTDVAGIPEMIADAERVDLSHHWDIGVLYGPHGAPDFFTQSDIQALFNSDYEVHFNSARTGVRLIGPKPDWARRDGGEAGLHPSNIHDNAYAVGAIDFTGDMPIILGPDGPSLGGFVCPAVVAQGELWKLGQLKPGDTIRFHPVTDDQAAALRQGPLVLTASAPTQSDVLQRRDGETPVTYRRAGDDYLLVEYGPLVLDIGLRLRAHLLMQALVGEKLPGIIDLTPGIRSLQVHYDSRVLPRAKLLAVLDTLEDNLPDPRQVRVPSRIVHLPLSWNDAQAELAMRKYQELVRPNAPWCPSNIEFIRRINGLKDEAAVRSVVFDASYLVLGLGDVYLGAPVATPVDPRHRLVTTKYNPARTWTPENAVGIGGAYLCIYGMEGPGGYQLFGRTIQMWNRWRKTREFDQPWLLRFFDQIRFYPVSDAELLEARAAFPHGGYPLRIEETEFSYGDYEKFLSDNRSDIATFKDAQQQAFEAERQRWREQGLDSFVSDDGGAVAGEDDVPAGAMPVHASAMGTVWKQMVAPGATVAAGETLLVIESMKMEIDIVAPTSGILREWRCAPGKVVRPGQVVALMEDA